MRISKVEEKVEELLKFKDKFPKSTLKYEEMRSKVEKLFEENYPLKGFYDHFRIEFSKSLTEA
jgi:hypothetical protein